MSNIYVFYGEEQSLITKEINKIIMDILGELDENKISKYSLIETSLSDVLDDAKTIPFFSNKKVIICNDCLFLTGTSNEEMSVNGDELLEYIGDPNESTVLFFVVNHNKLDERKKIVKELKNKGIVREYNKLSNNDLMGYVKQSFNKDSYKIDMQSISMLIDRVNGSIDYLDGEIEKLKLLKDDEKIVDEQDIIEVVRESFTDNIFAMIDAVIKKDIDKTLMLYEQLLVHNEEPIKIITMLANQFRLIYQTKKLYKLGFTEKDIASKLGIHPYRIKLANEVNLNENTLLRYIDRLADLDIDIKTGKVNKEVGLELFILQI